MYYIIIFLNLLYYSIALVNIDIRILPLRDEDPTPILSKLHNLMDTNIGTWKISKTEILPQSPLAPEPSHSYDSCILLDKEFDFQIHYSIDPQNESIHIALQATIPKGWISLGISLDGSMNSRGVVPGSDIVLGYVDQSTCVSGCVFDYSAVFHGKPVLDQQQDVYLRHGSWENGKLSLEFQRKFFTNDSNHDRMIDPHIPINLIWALNRESIPLGPEIFSKHSKISLCGIDILLNNNYTCQTSPSVRITLSNVTLAEVDPTILVKHLSTTIGVENQLYVVNMTETEDKPFCPNCLIFETKFNNFSISSDDTTYMCFGFQFPINETYHAIRFQPIRDNVEVLHHILLWVSDRPWTLGTYTECSSMPNGALPMYAWAPGSKEVVIPEEVGFLVGEASPTSKYVILQIHYDNPSLKSGLVDSSGVKLYLTPELRTYDAGLLFLGVPEELIEIPPAKENWQQATFCPASNTKYIENVPGQKLHFFSHLTHQHLLGKQLWTEVIRNSEKKYEIGPELHYDFRRQHFIPIDIDLLPGDLLVTHCVWSSQGKSTTTKGGISTRDEMCIHAIMYYPNMPGVRGCSTKTPIPGVECEYPCLEQTWQEVVAPIQKNEWIRYLSTWPVVVGVTFVGLLVVAGVMYRMRRTRGEGRSKGWMEENVEEKRNKGWMGRWIERRRGRKETEDEEAKEELLNEK